MDDKKITITKIRLDRSRRAAAPTDAVVLLYDDSKDCYYETTIESICSAVMRKVASMFSEKCDDIDAIISRFGERISEIESQQDKFIRDTASINAALIEMVKSHE